MRVQCLSRPWRVRPALPLRDATGANSTEDQVAAGLRASQTTLSGVRTGRSRPRRDVACLIFERPDRRPEDGARRERSGRGDTASQQKPASDTHRCISADPRTDVAPGIPEAAICVQDVDVQCVLQFTLIHAAGCALHRRTSRVIHRLELFLRTPFDWRVRRAAPQRRDRDGAVGRPSPDGPRVKVRYG